MFEIIKDWVRDIFIVVIILGFVEIILPTGGMKKYIKYIFSIVIVGVILSPLNCFIDDDFFQSFYKDYIGYFSGTDESGFLEDENQTQNEKFNRTQNIMIENVYKEKIISEVRNCINDYYPELKIYDIEVFFSESGKSNENYLPFLNKIVIIGEETEYVSNIIRCVAQRLEVEDGRISYCKE